MRQSLLRRYPPPRIHIRHPAHQILKPRVNPFPQFERLPWEILVETLCNDNEYLSPWTISQISQQPF